MLSLDELKLLNHGDLSKFPMINAVKSMHNGCTSCRSRRVNIKSALKLAVQRYAHNKDFIDMCRRLYNLPVILGGQLIGGK